MEEQEHEEKIKQQTRTKTIFQSHPFAEILRIIDRCAGELPAKR